MQGIRAVLFILLLAMLSGCASKSTSVDGHGATQTAAEKLVVRAADSIQTMRAESDWMDTALEDAEAVLIFPGYFRIGYLASAGGAKGVLMVRDKAGFWSGPAFYSMGQLGGGLQIGVEYGSIVYVIHDPELIADVAQSRWQLDAQASVVAISTDRRHQATEMTENLGAVLFTDMDGLFAGVSLDGAYVDTWDAGMAEFHGTGVTVEDALQGGAVDKDETQELLEALLSSGS